MRKDDIILERIYRRLIAESSAPSIEGLAAYISSFSATLYNPNRLLADLRAVKGGLASDDILFDACSRAVVGEITIEEPNDPCLGAWYVGTIAGEGYGKILYGLGYALSPEGILMPDREAVSHKAYRAWSKQTARRVGEFDDAALPVDQRRTPNDPSDDCTLHKSNDGDCKKTNRDPMPLNYAYKAEGWEDKLALDLKRAHNAAMAELPKLYINRKTLEGLLLMAGRYYFSDTYGEEVEIGNV